MCVLGGKIVFSNFVIFFFPAKRFRKKHVFKKITFSSSP